MSLFELRAQFLNSVALVYFLLLILTFLDILNMFFKLMFNIPSTQGRCRLWASVVSFGVLFHGPLKKYRNHYQGGLCTPLGPAHPGLDQPTQRNQGSPRPWPGPSATLITQFSLLVYFVHIAPCSLHGPHALPMPSPCLDLPPLNSPIPVPAQLPGFCRGLLVESEELAGSLASS